MPHDFVIFFRMTGAFITQKEFVLFIGLMVLKMTGWSYQFNGKIAFEKYAHGPDIFLKTDFCVKNVILCQIVLSTMNPNRTNFFEL